MTVFFLSSATKNYFNSGRSSPGWYHPGAGRSTPSNATANKGRDTQLVIVGLHFYVILSADNIGLCVQFRSDQ